VHDIDSTGRQTLRFKVCYSTNITGVVAALIYIGWHRKKTEPLFTVLVSVGSPNDD